MRLAAVAFVVGCIAVISSPLEAVTVVEYYHAGLDHYFVTPLRNEIDALDSGRIAGWARTGLAFDAFDAAAAALSPVCRFRIPPEHGDSHFLSASPTECAVVLAKIGVDRDFSGYVLETPAEFYIALPDTATGGCPAGTAPVYRLWNGRADSNHRYTADRATRDAMMARGYVPEGYGPDSVAMCTPRASVGDSQVRVSASSPFDAGCDVVSPGSTVYAGAEVEPQLAIDPQDPAHLIGVWQQDRWSDGGARGIRTGTSFDGGLTWSLTQAPLSRCTGGNVVNGGNYARASDPWVAIGPDRIAYQIAIAFTGATLAPGATSAVLASRSIDGGRTWSAPATLIRDVGSAFNDKESIAADPLAAGFAYAAWDRLEQGSHGPSWFTRTTDGGGTWEAARRIYDPGLRNQTLNNQIVVAASGANAGTLYDFFTEFQVGESETTRHFAVVRSNDRGVTWSAPVTIAASLPVGVHDPQNPGRDVRDAADIASFASGPNGMLVGAWQDARFSGGARDGIAFSRSADGGATWSEPVQINAVATTQAFLPAVTVRPDGTIGVLYYDMRNDTASADTLLVDTWLATSPDGVIWSERHVSGPFDLAVAPIADGELFVGDYQGIAGANGVFAALFARTNADASNRTDITASVFRSAIAAGGKTAYRARRAPPLAITPELQERWQRSIDKTLRRRLVGHPPPLSGQHAPQR